MKGHLIKSKHLWNHDLTMERLLNLSCLLLHLALWSAEQNYFWHFIDEGSNSIAVLNFVDAQVTDKMLILKSNGKCTFLNRLWCATDIFLFDDISWRFDSARGPLQSKFATD